MSWIETRPVVTSVQRHTLPHVGEGQRHPAGSTSMLAYVVQSLLSYPEERRLDARRQRVRRAGSGDGGGDAALRGPAIGETLQRFGEGGSLKLLRPQGPDQPSRLRQALPCCQTCMIQVVPRPGRD